MVDFSTLKAEDLWGLSPSAVAELAGRMLAELRLKDEQLERDARTIRFKCVFQPIVDAISARWWTAFQRDRGRRFSLIVDAVSASSWTTGWARR